MKFHRIYAIFLRFMYLFRNSYDRMSDVFYWPTVDILLWGLTSAYVMTVSTDKKILMSILGGLILWFVVWRAQYEISVNILEDLWNKNLVNIFVSPLKFSEWILAFLLIGVIKIIISVIFAACLAYGLYKVNIFMYGLYLLPAIPLLTMTGWTIGMFVSSFILRFGTRIQTIAWSLPYIIAPFAAIYFPLAILPEWAQKIAWFIPVSHVFESARKVIYEGKIDYQSLLISLILNIIYLTGSVLLLRNSFKKVLNKGLASVY